MRIKSFKLFESVSKEFTKDGKNYEIVYTGDKDLNQDGFLIHFTGYDDAIGNKIIGFLSLVVILML
jgi:hypothetical protein